MLDHGRGIPPDVLDKVFDRFSSNSLGSRHRGVGLGLSIVQSFVELHGGTVHIDSTPARGTCVTCTFPLLDALIPNAEPQAAVGPPADIRSIAPATDKVTAKRASGTV